MWKNKEDERRWRRAYGRRQRRIAAARRRGMPLHLKLGIETITVRVAIIEDPRMGYRFDPKTRAYSNNHLYRESITLARV